MRRLDCNVSAHSDVRLHQDPTRGVAPVALPTVPNLPRKPQKPSSQRALAARYQLNPKTVAKWRARQTTGDAAMGPCDPCSTVLSPAEEAMVVEFRRRTLLPLDDIMGCLRDATQSALRRCLQRHDISRLPAGDATPQGGKFTKTKIGFVTSAALSCAWPTANSSCSWPSTASLSSPERRSCATFPMPRTRGNRRLPPGPLHPTTMDRDDLRLLPSKMDADGSADVPAGSSNLAE